MPPHGPWGSQLAGLHWGLEAVGVELISMNLEIVEGRGGRYFQYAGFLRILEVRGGWLGSSFILASSAVTRASDVKMLI